MLPKKEKTEANQCSKKQRPFCFQKKKKQRLLTSQKNRGRFAYYAARVALTVSGLPNRLAVMSSYSGYDTMAS